MNEGLNRFMSFFIKIKLKRKIKIQTREVFDLMFFSLIMKEKSLVLCLKLEHVFQNL